MNRRQFLSGFAAAFAGWLARGVKVEEEPEQAAGIGRLSAQSVDNWGTLFGLPIVIDPDLDTGIVGDIVLGDLETYKGQIHVSDELLEDAACLKGIITRMLSDEIGAMISKTEHEILYGTGGAAPQGILHYAGAEHQEIVSLPPDTLTTRVRHQVSHHASFTRDEARLAALYDVRGTDKRLVLEMWMSHEDANDEAVVEALLEWMDQDAEWSAAHPDEIPSMEGAWI